jgi:hypothetical protein
MSVSMSLSSYEIEHDSMEEEYSDDILYAGWNPEIDLLSQQLQLVQATEQADESSSISDKVAELFLRRMYSFPR